jgi:hypothetical protein
MSHRTKEAKMFKRFVIFMLGAMLAFLIFQYLQLDESKKRYVNHLIKQVPYLPARYFA